MNVYHVYAHGRGETTVPWNELADTVAKKAIDGFISKCGPFNLVETDDNAAEDVVHTGTEKEVTKENENASDGTTNIFIDSYAHEA